MPLLSNFCVTICTVCTHTVFNLQLVHPAESTVRVAILHTYVLYLNRIFNIGKHNQVNYTMYSSISNVLMVINLFSIKKNSKV